MFPEKDVEHPSLKEQKITKTGDRLGQLVNKPCPGVLHKEQG